MYFRPPKFIARLFPGFIWSFPDEADSVFLTFDDGPNPDITPWILEQLRKYNAKATFFCLGKNVEMHPETFKMILDEGHSVGNHTYSHQKGWSMSVGDYVQDVDLADTFIKSPLLRPPYGRIKPSQGHVLTERYKIIMWDTLSRDYSRTLSRKGCVNNVIKVLRPGAIIVFHDSYKAEKNLRYALPRVLDYIQNVKGYKMKSIEY